MPLMYVSSFTSLTLPRGCSYFSTYYASIIKAFQPGWPPDLLSVWLRLSFFRSGSDVFMSVKIADLF